MKLETIDTKNIRLHLTRFNVILSEAGTFRLPYCTIPTFAMPENAKHPTAVVEWLNGILHDRAIIYTFSEAVVNHFGALIRAGKIQPKDIKVFLVQGEETINSYFDSRGALLNWPYGWFSPKLQFLN